MATTTAALNSLIVTISNKRDRILELYSRYETVQDELRSSNEELANLDRKLQDMNQLEETLDQEFMDLNSQPPAKGALAKLGLRSTQDWVLALFFLSYGIFCIVAILNVMRYSTQKLRVGFFTGGVLILLGFMITALIWRVG